MSSMFPSDISWFPQRSRKGYNRLKFSEIFTSKEQFKSCFPDQELIDPNLPATEDNIRFHSMKYIADDYWDMLSIYLEDFYVNVKHQWVLDPQLGPIDKGVKKGMSTTWFALQKFQAQWERLRDLSMLKNDRYFANDTTVESKNNTATANNNKADSLIYNQQKVEPKKDENGNVIPNSDVDLTKYLDDGNVSASTSTGTNQGTVTTKNTKYNIDQLDGLLDISEDPDAWVIDRLIHFIAAPWQPDDKENVYE